MSTQAICKYYLKGECRYGNKCHYLHTAPKDVMSDRKQVSYTDSFRSHPSAPRPIRPLAVSRYNTAPAPSTSKNVDNFSFKTNSSQGSGIRPDVSKYSWKKDSSLQHMQRKVQQHENLRVQVSNDDSDTRTVQKTPPGNRKVVQDAKASQDVDYWISTIKNDMLEWMNSGQWMYSAYGFCTDKPSAFGFPDYSQEELRLAAMESQKNNTVQAYINDVSALSEQYKVMWNKLLNISPQDKKLVAKHIEAILGENKNLIGATQMPRFNREVLRQKLKLLLAPDCSHAELSSQVPPTSLTTDKSPSNFLFQLPKMQQLLSPNFAENKNEDARRKVEFTNMSDSFGAKGTKNFQGKSEIRTVINGNSTGMDSVYTKMSDLSDKQLKAFSDHEFSLGNVPSVPPPRELCV